MILCLTGWLAGALAGWESAGLPGGLYWVGVGEVGLELGATVLGGTLLVKVLPLDEIPETRLEGGIKPASGGLDAISDEGTPPPAGAGVCDSGCGVESIEVPSALRSPSSESAEPSTNPAAPSKPATSKPVSKPRAPSAANLAASASAASLAASAFAALASRVRCSRDLPISLSPDDCMFLPVEDDKRN
jgi:hypothetical protein